MHYLEVFRELWNLAKKKIGKKGKKVNQQAQQKN